MIHHNRYKSYLQVIILSLFFTSISCVYYNTFYNAKKYFDEAELIRLENEDRSLPVKAQTSYTKVIEKCNIVLEKYPESDYVNFALLLSGQAHFHKEEYNSAETKLNRLNDSGNIDFKQQATFWLALTKWKKGKVQPAIDQLTHLLDGEFITITKTLIHLYLADIYIELKELNTALDHLENAAKNTTDRKEKGRIYQRLSELAFNKKEYSKALFAYEQVIKNSMVKKLKLDAHLQISKIYRIIGEFEPAIKKIKSLLINDEFRELFGALELELVKIYELKNEKDSATERLKSIIKDYPSTVTSAEAYFMLGKKTIQESWNLDLANEYFAKSNKESRKSPVQKESQEMISQINQYQTGLKAIFDKPDSTSIKVDSLSSQGKSTNDSTSTYLVRSTETAKTLLQLAELEAFRFQNYDSALVHLNLFIAEFPDHELFPKAIYMKYYLLKNSQDSTNVDSLKILLTTQFSETEYAEAVRKDMGIEKEKSASEEQFILAETAWFNQNKSEALRSFKIIIHKDTLSNYALKSGYFLGNKFDYEFFNPDSALKYYDWVSKYFPESEQAIQSKPRINQITLLLSPPDTSTVELDSISTSQVDSTKFQSALSDSSAPKLPVSSIPPSDSIKIKKSPIPNDY